MMKLDLDLGTLYMIVFIILAMIVYLYYKYKSYRDSYKWDNGISKFSQSRLQYLTPFDPTKDILYASRNVVGYWHNRKNITSLINEDKNLEMLKMLAKTYNIILYIPYKDKCSVIIDELQDSIAFIAKKNFPITYITQKLPNRKMLEPFPVNNGEIWFIRYKRKDDKRKWEEYM